MSKSSGSRQLLVIHHSHTDIGYTAPQAIIERYHVDFIRQALRIVESDVSRQFKWTCETFWGVERFLAAASDSGRARFRQAVRDRRIGLSGSYLNFNELLDLPVLSEMTGRAQAFGDSIGVPVEAAMTADINGFGWGFARALLDHDIKNLFTCIHTHHGMFPLGRRHVGFWWETPGGERLLVWSGEHYHYGN